MNSHIWKFAVGLTFVVTGAIESATLADEKKAPASKHNNTPFVQVGPTIHLFSGPQLNPCQCTTLTGLGMKEVRLSLILVRDGSEVLIEERSYKWDAWPEKPVAHGIDSDSLDGRTQGVLQVQLHKTDKPNQFSLAFGAGFERHAAWDHIRKPRETIVESDLATTQYTSLRGLKKAGEVHIASIYAIHGADKAELGDVKAVEDLKRKSLKHKGTTFLLTTLYWTADR
jgi:hypothetical protein